jgi:acetylornithine deacetylase/succinyl-diaminopimelate desuccinylase-like protein
MRLGSAASPAREPPPGRCPSRAFISGAACARLRGMTKASRRDFLGATAASAAVLAVPRPVLADDGVAAIRSEVAKRHAEGVLRLQEWVKLPSIAAENRGFTEGCELMMRLLREAGFQSVTRVATDGQPGVFATLDAGAPRTVGLYFMYDVKQADPSEWSSPPFDAAIVDKPGFGKVLMGRGAVNQKGPQAAFLAALHAIRGVGRKPPVNLVLVAEGEEEIGSPHFPQVVGRPEVSAALKRCQGVFMPSAVQDPDGTVIVSLGAKGVVELELVSSGEKWGRGPKKDVHSSNRARLDSPAFHLVQALATLVTAEGDPAIDGFADAARSVSAGERAMLDAAATRLQEATAKRLLSADRWAHDLSWRASLERFISVPTVNIEGLVAGHTGPGGKTVLPHRAVAKLDLRLVPDMTFDGAVAALKAHLAKRGFGDIEVNPSGGYDPTSTSADAAIIRAESAVYRRAGLDPILWPRNAGSYPGYVFTGEPLKLPSGHFGLGHGSGAHAPDEYFVVESANPKVMGWDGAVMSYVDYLHELATIG